MVFTVLALRASAALVVDVPHRQATTINKLELDLTMQQLTAQLSMLFSSEFLSAIAGAVVGGIIAYVVQLQALREERKARADQKREEENAAAYALFFKVLSIYNNLNHIKNYVVEAREALQSRADLPLSATLKPLANVATPIFFDTTEMALLLSLKEPRTLNAVLPLDAIHNGILPAWHLYASKKDRFNQLVTITEFEPNTGIAAISFRRGSAAEGLMYEVKELAEALAGRAERDAETAQMALEALIEMLNRRLSLEINFQPKATNGARSTSTA